MAVKKTYRINLRNYGSPPAVMVSQYDEGYAIAFEIFDGPLPVLASSLSGYTFKLKGRQPGNPPFLAYEFEGTLATALNAVVSFEIDTTMTGRAGKGTAELVILDEENDVKFASVNFAVYTEPAAVPDGSIDADVERAQEIADEVQDIVDTAAAEVKGEAESWAVGERDGEPVSSDDPTYENNAKYYSQQAAQIAEDISGVTDQVATNTSDISDLKEDLNAVSENVKSRNLFNGHVTDGYITPNGNVYGGSTYHYTDKIDTSDKHGKTLYFVNNGNTSATFRFLCAYGSDGNPIESAGLNSASSNYTVPSYVDSVVVSFSQAVTGVSIEADYPSTVYTGFYDYWQLKKYPPIDGAINIPMPMVKTADSLVDGGLIGFGSVRNSVKRGNQTFEMYCKVPNGVPHNAYVILGKNSSAGYAFGVTDEKWNYFVNDVPVSDGYNHGLTIKDYLYIRIAIKDEDGIAYINIRTNGGTYSRTHTSWGGVHGVPYCTNKGNIAITDVRFTWTCESFRHRIWIFGDSYTTVAQTRWPYYLYDLGLNKNVLINGYAGETSYDGYYDWKGCLPFGTPSIALWLYGMNNADNGAVNADWLTYTRLFLKDCEDRDITPILATIPCCPQADNSYKNAWVRASGYRYIEFADAVNVERDSTTWYDNMLSSDNIHPDVQGAIALASRVFVDVPELFIN